jgi:hypothetical protein
MSRASLFFVFSLVVLAIPAAARAADPAGAEKTDPFAPSDTKEPSMEDQEAAVLGPPARPAPPAPPPAAQARRQRNDEEHSTVAAVTEAGPTGIAIELSTSGFASGTLQGGLFVGGRTPTGMIIGGFFDYGLTSITSTLAGGVDVANSMQTFRLGVGVRQAFLRSADRRVELYGAGDVSFDYKSAEVPVSTTPSTSMSAAGFSLALGPGLRLWVHDQISIGYVARFRFSFLSGEAGVLGAMPTDDPTDSKLTQIGFDGVFQILAIF